MAEALKPRAEGNSTSPSPSKVVSGVPLGLSRWTWTTSGSDDECQKTSRILPSPEVVKSCTNLELKVSFPPTPKDVSSEPLGFCRHNVWTFPGQLRWRLLPSMYMRMAS